MIYFESLRGRIRFPVMQEFCAQKGLPSARGWDQLKAKLIAETEGSPKRIAEISEILQEIFVETIPLGTRAVKIFQVASDLRANYFAALQSIQPELSDYREIYPAPLTPERLASAPAELKACSVATNNEGTSVQIILCGRRTVEIREPRTRNDISAGVINELGWDQYDEFILIKRRFVQTYEVIQFNRITGTLELRAEELSGTDTVVALQALQNKANDLLTRSLGTHLHLAQCQNLFPAIRAIYNNPSAGIIVELGFTTATGSAKHEKMRVNRADLRTELFHVGGKTAINGALTPFRVAARWPAGGQRAQSMQEEVLLPGSIRQLASGTPFLDYMVLSGALTEPMMQAMVARVLAHLPP